MNNIFIIPIRSGSKGLPNKNMLNNSGKPLVMHTIDKIRKEYDNENIFVSTDSLEYKKILEKLNVNVIMRGKEIAGDNVPTSEVILDFLNKFEEKNFNLILCQATSPRRTGIQIREAISLLDDETQSIVSVVESDKSKGLLSTIDENGYIADLDGIDRNYTRQNQQKYFIPNGAIYVTTKEKYLNNKSFFLDTTKPYIMNKYTSIDIDGLTDYLEFIKEEKKLEFINNNSDTLLITNKRLNAADLNYDKLIIDEYNCDKQIIQVIINKYEKIINNSNLELENCKNIEQINQKYNLDNNNSIDATDNLLQKTIDGYHYTNEYNNIILNQIKRNSNEK